MKELVEAIQELEIDIGVKRGFFTALLAEDDWSFIIKLHALYEAAISNLLLNKIGHKEIGDFISRIELGDKSKGKLRLVKDFNFLESGERKFIYALSEIRNNFVHNVKNTNLDLKKYFESLDSKKLKNYIETFGFTYGKTIEVAGKSIDSKKFTRENPKLAIWQNSIYVLGIVSYMTSTEKSKKSTKKMILYNYDLQQELNKLQEIQKSIGNHKNALTKK